MTIREARRRGPLLVLLAALVVSASALARVVQPSELLCDASGAPVRVLAGHRLVETRVTSALVLGFVAEGAPDSDTASRIDVRVEPTAPGRAALARSPSFDFSYARIGRGGPPEAAAVAVTRAVADLVRASDPGDLQLPLLPPRADDPGGPPGAPGATLAPRQVVEAASQALTLALLLAWLALALPGLRRAGADVFFEAPGARRPDRAGWVTLAAVVGGAALRLALPHKLVLYYLGYEQAQIADSLSGIPKYGPGGFVLYHAIFWLTGPSHVAMIAVNRVFGGLIPLLGAAVLGRAGASRRAVALGAWLLAFVPLFPRNAVTESLLVPMLAWLLMAVHGAQRWRGTHEGRDLALATVSMLLAMLTRPEALALGPLTLVLLVPLAPRGPGRRTGMALAALAPAALVLLVRLAQLGWRMADEVALGNTPQIVTMGVSEWARAMLWDGLIARDGALWPRFFPVFPVTAAALVAVMLRPVRRAVLCLLAGAAACLAVSRLDLPYMSIPRVQEPGLALVALAAALGADALLDAAAARSRWWSAGLAAFLALALVAGSARSVPGLWEKSNADDEEDALNEALALLPPGELLLARRGFDDPPAERIPMHFPDYLVRPPARTIPLQQLLDAGPQGPTYAWLGVRCHLRACDKGGEHPACRAVRARFRLTPVLERRVPSREADIPEGFRELTPVAAGMRHDHDFPYCSAVGELTIGLYRVDGPAGP